MITYQIRPATVDDVDTVIGLRTEAEVWLAAQGIDQWPPEFFDYARRVLRTSVRHGATWVVADGDGPVIGTVTLGGPDRAFWDAGDAIDTGMYLGKLIVARSHAGADVGTAVLNWVSARALWAGKRWVRLDCRRDNTALHRYYEGRGFVHVRTVVRPGRFSGALFQRPAGLLTPARASVVEVVPGAPRIGLGCDAPRHHSSV